MKITEEKKKEAKYIRFCPENILPVNINEKIAYIGK